MIMIMQRSRTENRLDLTSKAGCEAETLKIYLVKCQLEWRDEQKFECFSN